MALSLRPLSSELARVAKEELNEVPERIAEDIQALKDWIAKQPHLRGRTDDQFLLTFLRGTKYSLERAKEKYDMYYTLRSLMPEIFLNRDPTSSRFLEILHTGTVVPLPNTITPGGPRILLLRPTHYEPGKYSIEEVMKVNFMFADILTREDDNLTVSGQMGVIDLSKSSMSHFVQMTPTFSKKMTMLTQEASPLRLKGFHYINTPTGFETVFGVFKGFMNEKNRQRLFVHGSNYEALYKHIPKKLLPAEYGGEAGPIKDILSVWEKKLLSYREFYQEDHKYGTDEKKRPGRPKNADNLFGVEGSFRKLNID